MSKSKAQTLFEQLEFFYNFQHCSKEKNKHSSCSITWDALGHLS